MTRRQKSKGALTDLVRLNPFDDANDDLIVVVIETPMGSHNKYAYARTALIFAGKLIALMALELGSFR